MKGHKGIQQIDVCEIDADALVYSTNVLLNCTGGVGACLLRKYGPQFQEALHGYLKDSGRKFADQGEVIQLVTDLMPYKNVFHTLPCDGFYNTTPEIVAGVIRFSLQECLKTGINNIAMSALATGYGHLQYDQFFRVASTVLNHQEFDPLNVTICIQHDFSVDLVREQIAEENLGFEVRT